MEKSSIGSHPALIFGELPSTSTYLRENDEPVGTLVLARSQSAGRGRRGNGFYSEGGLYFSVKLPRSMPDGEMWAVTFMAANAVCDAVAELGLRPEVKWVNDVYLGGKKLCGILTEVRQDCLILGIGVNLKRADFPCEIADTVAALEDEGVTVTADALCESIISRFDRAFEGWQIPETLEKYRSRCFLLGRDITYVENGERRCARVTGIADNGNLLCERDGEQLALHSGEVHTVRGSVSS